MSDTSGRAAPKDAWSREPVSRYLAVVLALAALVVFNVGPRGSPAPDSAPARLLPVALYLDGRMTFDGFCNPRSLHPVASQSCPGHLGYYFAQTRHGVYSAYPLATGLLAAPVYLIPMIVFDLTGTRDRDAWLAFADRMDRRAATVFASAAVWVFFRVATAFGLSLATSTALTIFFAFGSQTLSTSSHALWMHGPGVLVLLLLTWLAVPGAGPMRNRERIAASVLAGLAVAIRPSNLVLAAPLWLLIVRRERYPWRSLAALILPGTTIGAALAGYNVVIFGRLSGAYPASSFSGDPLSGLLGLLFSPGRGLVLYFPITLVAVVAPLLATAVRRDPLLRAAAMGVIGAIVVVAPWINWWGGYSFGPRLLTETQPFLLLIAGAAIERADRRGARRALAIISVAVLLPWSVAVQVAGTFSRGPGLWNALPESVDQVPARLWSWSDNPVGRAFRRQTGSQ